MDSELSPKSLKELKEEISASSIQSVGSSTEPEPEKEEPTEQPAKLPDISEVEDYNEVDRLVEIAESSKIDPFYGYSRDPMSESQYEKAPTSIKLDILKADIFDLATPEGLARYNDFLSLADRTTRSPRIQVERHEVKDTDSSWKVLVMYHEIWYKNVLKS